MMINKIEDIRSRNLCTGIAAYKMPGKLTTQLSDDIAYLLSEYDRMREALEWTKRKFEKEWTYEMGIGEVVDDIIRRFENAAEANRGL